MNAMYLTSMRRVCLYPLGLFVFTLPWQNAFSIAGSRTVSSFLGVAILWLALSVVLAEWRLRRPTPFLLAVVVFTLWQLASVFWSLDQAATVSRVATLAQLVGMIWLITELAQSEARKRVLIQAFVLGCFVNIAVITQAYLTGQAMDGYRFAPEDFSLNETADTMALGIVMALLLLQRGRKSRLFWLNAAYIPLAVFAVVLTASRSGFIAACIAFVGVAFVLWRAKPGYRIAWAGALVVVLLGLAVGLAGSETLNQNLERVTFAADTGSLATMTGRTVIWSAGYEVFKANPLGTGAATFRQSVGGLLDRARAPHNLFVSVAVETGIVGLILVSAILIAAVAPSTLSRGAPSRALYVIMFAVLVATALVANVDTSKVLWFGLAILSVGGHMEKPATVAEPTEADHPPDRVTAWSKEAYGTH